ncbi:outer membrane protein assembly factor BamE [Massilia sp. ZL223]|uniref:outer membrane protein assembly factor BamE n=1 Tax=Massilia sp. ZL223 TaxID=2824904 RepID=UPI001E2996E6|nr:outer membrane protein assembly factor BamE [Massilia sp. ZL223]
MMEFSRRFAGENMTNIVKIAISAAALALAGCTLPQAPLPGEPLEAVRAKLGAPTAVYPMPDGQMLEYATGPFGQYTYMARIGQDGRLVSWEQVLTGEKFATIKIDRATKEDVLRTLGRPAEVSRVALRNYEVWSYRYKEAGVWDSLMHVHFDEQGVVRQMMNGPDPRFERDGKFGL